MRRADREVTDFEEIREILTRAQVLRIAMNHGMYPYIVPVNFGFEMDGGRLKLYFHGAKSGRKYEILKEDPHVSFETDGGHLLIPPAGSEACTASFAYESVIGNGIAKMVEGAEKERLLTRICRHYGIEAERFSPAQLANTAVYQITAETFTAKRRSR